MLSHIFFFIGNISVTHDYRETLTNAAQEMLVYKSNHFFTFCNNSYFCSAPIIHNAMAYTLCPFRRM